jgi:hypothetical protein
MAATTPDQRLSSAADPMAPRPIVGKREATDYSAAGSSSTLDHADQKRAGRLGSLAGGVPQTSMSSRRGVPSPLHQILVMALTSTTL